MFEEDPPWLASSIITSSKQKCTRVRSRFRCRARRGRGVEKKRLSQYYIIRTKKAGSGFSVVQILYHLYLRILILVVEYRLLEGHLVRSRGESGVISKLARIRKMIFAVKKKSPSPSKDSWVCGVDGNNCG